MFSRRSLLKGLGWSGAAAGLGGVLRGAAEPAGQQPGPEPAKAPHQMWTPNPEAVRMARDFPAAGVKKLGIPYRGRIGKVKFPNDARVAALVFVSLDYYIAPPVNRRDALFPVDFWELSETSEYNFSIGGWRALELLEKHGVKSTVFANGFGLLKYPKMHREYHRLGHEIAAHGWDSRKGMVMYTPQQEAECIRATTEQVAEVVGDRPRGWISPQVQCTERTFGLLAQAGYQWHGDLRDDDIPYLLRIGDRTLVEIPFRTLTTDDYGCWGVGRSRIGLDPEAALDYFRQVLDLYVETGEDYPLLMVFGIHPYTGCVPDRSRAIEGFLKYLQGHPQVWVAQYQAVAEYWKNTYAAHV